MRSLAGISIALLVAGCGIDFGVESQNTVPAPPFPECRADAYVFFGTTSLAALGLDRATPVSVSPLDAGRTGDIWVTEPILFDPGPPGGPVEMVRQFCVEFPDGSGMSGWPIDDAWQLPAAFGGIPTGGSDLPLGGVLVIVIGALLLIGASILAFRQRASTRS